MERYTQRVAQSSPTDLTADDVALILRHRDHFKPGQADYYIEAGSVGSQFGGRVLTIGGLIQLWTSGQWVIPCARCSGRLYLVRVGGSLLSGNHSTTGICLGCREQITGPLPGSFGTYYASGMAISTSTGMPVVTQSVPRHGFDWKDGISTHPTGVNVTQEPEFQTVTLTEKMHERRVIERFTTMNEEQS